MYTIICIICFVCALLFTVLGLFQIREQRLLTSDDLLSTDGIIIEHRRIGTGDEPMGTMLLPRYTYTVNGTTYTRENPSAVSRQLKKHITVRYSSRKPKVSYIEEAGVPQYESGAILLFLLAGISCFGAVICLFL